MRARKLWTLYRYTPCVAVLLTSCGTFSGPPPNPCDGKLDVESTQESNWMQLTAKNSCHVPLVISLSFSELRNLEPSRQLPVEVSVPANSTVHLLRLDVSDPLKPSRASPNVLVRIGTAHPAPDENFEYQYPFGGLVPRKLTQGVDGSVTHTGKHRYAFDFDMPIGTPVLAARPGIVFQVVDGFPEGGFDKSYEHRSNALVILHSDNTFAGYGHLRVGILFQEGESISVGDILGYSGNSGYSRGPHLHFHVLVQTADGQFQTIPIVFRGGVVPIEGEVYGPVAFD